MKGGYTSETVSIRDGVNRITQVEVCNPLVRNELASNLNGNRSRTWNIGARREVPITGNETEVSNC